MADATKIEWTDATWNPITGCSVVSPGCTNCYAMRLAGTRLRNHPSRAGLTRDTKAGPVWTGEVRLNDAWLRQPLAWSRPRRIFVCAHGDLFAENVPDEWIDQVFAVMALARRHTFQVLTKRSARMREYLRELVRARRRWEHIIRHTHGHSASPPPVLPNVWLGVSVEDQRRAGERLPDLEQTPAEVRWVSAEPLIGSLDIRTWLPRLDWVVAGGESGPAARPMHIEWARSLRDQCAKSGVPLLFKQWGSWIIASHENGHTDSCMATNDAVWLDIDARQAKPTCNGMSEPIGMFRVPKTRAGRLLDGVEHDAYPEVRHVR
jgi:protein gp37